MDYGFILPGNPADRIQIRWDPILLEVAPDPHKASHLIDNESQSNVHDAPRNDYSFDT